uniref:Helitron helicase-like domain-containing protein n=1 Tax=Glycine max TaxID=3847 RepID=K7MCG0_SOYBN
MFSFTSINDGCGPPQFILSSQNYHCIGSLLPEEGYRSKDPHVYNISDANEIATLIVGDLDNMEFGRNIVIKSISKDISISQLTNESENHRIVCITLREWVTFRIQDRRVEFGHILNARRLFQKFLVESQRLTWIRFNQKSIRSDVLNGLQEAISRGETNPSIIGKCLHNGNDIDKIISAELPNPNLYPKLSKAVATYTMHRSCGLGNLKFLSMKERKCSKYFPKKFQNSTTIDEDEYSCYRRQDMRMSVHKNGINLDNRNVVPYSPLLLMRYEGHINTKYYKKSNSIKYLFKLNSEGNIEICNLVDEIKRYYDCKYLSPCEATWRTFAYDIHERWLVVQQLNFHLPN